MLTEQDAREVIGSTAYSEDGQKLGKVGQLFLDDESGQPEWITVNTGLFGTKETFVPVNDATWRDGELRVPYSKEKVKDAPNMDAEGGHLDHDEESQLYAYYGRSYDTAGRSYDTAGDGVTGRGTDADAAGRTGTGRSDHHTEGYDTSGPTTDDAMTRSEEQLEVGKTSQEAGRARLRKYVTTEQETHTVPVRKERAVLESEPITDTNVGDATSGPDISEEEHEVVLNEERAVVDKETVPVERVRLGKETTTEEQTVTDEVRKEHIEAEGDVDERR
jgi:uncharacterized protein (TIGR02271 family)